VLFDFQVGEGAMKGILKWLGIVLGGLLGLFALAAVVIMLVSNTRLNRTYTIDPGAIDVSMDEATIARGEHLAIIRGCTDCHGTDLSGAVLVDDPALGVIFGTNLTRGIGGLGNDYSDEALVLAIRHGIDVEGKGLLIMPSQEYFVLSDADLGAIIAYVRSLPSTDNVIPEPNLRLIGRALYLAGQLPPIAAEIIDHDAQRPRAPEIEVSADYGEYLATGCTGCHGSDFAGGSVPGRPPDFPLASNLTPAGNMASWDEADFVAAMRTGVTPEGKVMEPEVMPWPSTAEMTDLELGALWAYLQAIPAIESTSK
jgi:mono/diheme cytochrome c family protein